MKKYLFLLLLMIAPIQVNAGDTAACKTKFPNLINDICWDCAFPIKMFGKNIINPIRPPEDVNTGVNDSIPCSCTEMGLVKWGIPVSFWENSRMIDVTRTPYCMVSLGMGKLNIPLNDQAFGKVDSKSGTSFKHANWVINPVMTVLGVLLDSKCLDKDPVDVAMMSPTIVSWGDEDMGMVLEPDAILYSNITALVACSSDCVAQSLDGKLGQFSMVGNAISNALNWCSGCNGVAQPLSGTVLSAWGGVRSSQVIIHRATVMMHRMLTQQSTSGEKAMCGEGQLQITLDKSRYKNSMIFPKPQSDPGAQAVLGAESVDWQNAKTKAGLNDLTDAAESVTARSCGAGKCCQPFGRSTLVWGAGREWSVTGEDQAYTLFRKRDCCQY